jgi:hypothetical protein
MNENMYEVFAPFVESVSSKLGFDMADEMNGRSKRRKTNAEEKGETSFLSINKILYILTKMLIMKL